jgi:hypothetical protein
VEEYVDEVHILGSNDRGFHSHLVAGTFLCGIAGMFFEQIPINQSMNQSISQSVTVSITVSTETFSCGHIEAIIILVFYMKL